MKPLRSWDPKAMQLKRHPIGPILGKTIPEHLSLSVPPICLYMTQLWDCRKLSLAVLGSFPTLMTAWLVDAMRVGLKCQDIILVCPSAAPMSNYINLHLALKRLVFKQTFTATGALWFIWRGYRTDTVTWWPLWGLDECWRCLKNILTHQSRQRARQSSSVTKLFIH